MTDPTAYTGRAVEVLPAVDVPPSTAVSLDQAVTRAIASTQLAGSPASTQAPGTIVAVSGPSGTWTKAYGLADTTARSPMTTDLHHRIGSVTKSFTATVVLQLVAEGRLALTDHVDAYVPGVPQGDRTTIDELLTMRSGIGDYFDAFLPTWVATPDVAYTPDQMLQVGYAQPRPFDPGAGFDYSNSNYLLLGKVVEKVTGESIGDAVVRRVVTPLGLTGTSWPGESAELPVAYDHGYTTVVPADGKVATTPDGSLVDATAYNPAWSGAAGEMTSTIRDLLVYGRALGTGGGLLSASAQADRLAAFRPAFSAESQYGQGLICRSGWVGHGGDTLGYHTDLYYNGAVDTTVVVMMNRYPSYRPQAVVTALADAVGRPLAALE